MQKLTVVLPCAGRSSRYPGVRPKWMLTTPDGSLALLKAFASIGVRSAEVRVVVGIRQDHDEQYEAGRLVRSQIPEAEVIVLEKDTRGPAETVFELISAADVRGQIVIKDADSFFTAPELPSGSFIALADLRKEQDITRVGAKSFVVVNESSAVCAVVEKNVCSNFISAGMYGFENAVSFKQAFIDCVMRREMRNEIFVSHVMTQLIARGEYVEPIEVSNLIDVGTILEWRSYVAQRSSLVVDVDGVIVKNQSEFFRPYWSEQPEPIKDNVEHLLSLQVQGAQLIFMTSRPEKYRITTERILIDLGFKIHALIMNCNHGRRYLINDFAATNQYPSAVAINIPRNSDLLKSVLDMRG